MPRCASMEYIYLPYHYNKEATDLGFVDIRWIHTKENIADLFTKPVSRQVFVALIDRLTGHCPATKPTNTPPQTTTTAPPPQHR